MYGSPTQTARRSRKQLRGIECTIPQLLLGTTKQGNARKRKVSVKKNEELKTTFKNCCGAQCAKKVA